MYRGINRDNIEPNSRQKLMTVPEEAGHYLRNRNVYAKLRKAYLNGRIDRQELLTLRGQVKAGDANGAIKGLMRLLERDCVIFTHE